jgi:hypothetical protein
MNKLLAKILMAVIIGAVIPEVEGQQDKSRVSGNRDSSRHDSTVVVTPGRDIYRAGKFRKLWLGNNYREEWLTPVEAPVFDFRIGKRKLEISGTGGGFQTHSLRLRDDLGKEWVLRSVDKDPSSSIPATLRTDFAEDIVQDQISASHPFGALGVPVIAEAAGVFHTNPRLIYLSGDSVAVKYGSSWQGLYLLEERPDGNRDDVAGFGYSKKIIGTPKMLEEINDDQKSCVDQFQYLRSRLVDMLISDWDRHEDQWRWAAFKENGATVYRPVPRDRDMAFFVVEGIVPWFSTRPFLLRKIQGLDYQIKDLKGLNTQARHLDRRLLNELTRDDWNGTIVALKSAVSDDVIDQALSNMPKETANTNRDLIAAKLKARRDKLDKTALDYYDILSEKVDVVGTNKSDSFAVKRISNLETKVKIFNVSKKHKLGKPYYERVFNTAETKEIMLYGLDGDDVFQLEGSVGTGPKIHIVSGKGKDVITDNSAVKGISKKTIIYDNKSKTEVTSQGETKLVASADPEKFTYNYDLFNYNKLIPILYPGYSIDEGIFVAAGFDLTTFDFRRKPFASRHQVLFNYSTATRAKEFKYTGKYTDVFSNIDLSLNFHFRDPKFTRNYFGTGNETVKTSPNKDYNRVRIGELYISPELSHRFRSGIDISGGAFYQNTRIEETPGRYIADLQANGLDPNVFQRKQFIGLSAGLTFDKRDSIIYPTKGIYLAARNMFYYGLSGTDNRFNRLEGEAKLFLKPFKSSGQIAAFRAGGALNIGDYDFYQSNTVGGRENLRGYRYSRYSGFASVYQNTDLRIRLSRVKSYITKGYFGLIAFNDVGRVWSKGETSFKWHHGYGGGLWVSPYEMAIISAQMEFSQDEKKGLFSVRFGFLF